MNGVKIISPPVTSTTAKWHNWRVKLNDGSKISINFSQKAKDKTLVQVNHDNLLYQEEIEKWKAFWRKELIQLF